MDYSSIAMHRAWKKVLIEIGSDHHFYFSPLTISTFVPPYLNPHLAQLFLSITFVSFSHVPYHVLHTFSFLHHIQDISSFSFSFHFPPSSFLFVTVIPHVPVCVSYTRFCFHFPFPVCLFPSPCCHPTLGHPLACILLAARKPCVPGQLETPPFSQV